MLCLVVAFWASEQKHLSGAKARLLRLMLTYQGFRLVKSKYFHFIEASRNMDELEQIKRRKIDECHEDFVGIWELVLALDNAFPGQLDDDEVREMALRIIHEMLSEEKGIRAGDMMREYPHFIPWDLPPDEAIARIEERWKRMGGRAPGLFEIVALTVWPPERGD